MQQSWSVVLCAGPGFEEASARFGSKLCEVVLSAFGPVNGAKKSSALVSAQQDHKFRFLYVAVAGSKVLSGVKQLRSPGTSCNLSVVSKNWFGAPCDSACQRKS